MPLSVKGLQPVYVRVVNRSTESQKLHFRSLDPHYYPPLEAAARCHFSLLKRLYSFGILAWFFLPLLFLAPLKLLSIGWANQKIDELFQSLAFHRRPIGPGETAEGFVFTAFDAGTKMVRVRLLSIGKSLDGQHVAKVESAVLSADPEELANLQFESGRGVDLTFVIAVPSINSDYLHRKLDEHVPQNAAHDCDVSTLVERLKSVSTATCNRHNRGSGDPINLVLIGSFETLLNSFAGRWDETEVISLATCWKTARAFLLGSEYRYSPVSPLYLFGRSQDIALQQIRESISQRLHLRLWLAPLTLHGQPVWIGQVSRDIGVRFTTAAWNLTTHRIDADVDESRDYLLEDMLDAERVEAAGYVSAAPPSTPQSPRHNLTGDPYYTDGKRVVILLSPVRTVPRFVIWD